MYSRRIHCFSEQVVPKETQILWKLYYCEIWTQSKIRMLRELWLYFHCFPQSNFSKSIAEKKLFQIINFFKKLIQEHLYFFGPFVFNCQYISHQVFFCKTLVSILIYLTLISLKEETMRWQEITYFANNTLPIYIYRVQCNSIIKN